jgi:hypothetical protein
VEYFLTGEGDLLERVLLEGEGRAGTGIIFFFTNFYVYILGEGSLFI